MPYLITAEPSFLRIILYGVVTSQELQALADDELAIEIFRPVTLHRLNDLSAMTEPYLTYTAWCAGVQRDRIALQEGNGLNDRRMQGAQESLFVTILD
jgi:hypothetical protein